MAHPPPQPPPAPTPPPPPPRWHRAHAAPIPAHPPGTNRPVLDPCRASAFSQLFCNLRDQGKAIVVFVTHLSTWKKLHHIAIIVRVSILQLGTVAEVAAHTDASRLPVHVRLAEPVAGAGSDASLERSVNHSELTTRVSRSNTVPTVKTGGGRAQLLAELISGVCRIASFSPNAPGLEDALSARACNN